MLGHVWAMAVSQTLFLICMPACMSVVLCCVVLSCVVCVRVRMVVYRVVADVHVQACWTAPQTCVHAIVQHLQAHQHVHARVAAVQAHAFESACAVGVHAAPTCCAPECQPLLLRACCCLCRQSAAGAAMAALYALHPTPSSLTTPLLKALMARAVSGSRAGGCAPFDRQVLSRTFGILPQAACGHTMCPCAHTMCPCAHTMCPCAHTMCPCAHTMCPCGHTMCPCARRWLAVPSSVL